MEKGTKMPRGEGAPNGSPEFYPAHVSDLAGAYAWLVTQTPEGRMERMDSPVLRTFPPLLQCQLLEECSQKSGKRTAGQHGKVRDIAPPHGSITPPPIPPIYSPTLAGHRWK